jgi:predicted MFS family arabinose efflux permease
VTKNHNSDQKKKGERGLIMGVKQAGVQVGAFAIGALLPSLASAWGWRAALAPVIVVPVIGVGAALKIIPPDAGPSHETELGPVFGGFTPVVRRTTIYGFLMGLGVAAVSSYLPLYAREEVGMSVRMAGFVAALVGLVGILSRVFWGHLSERYGRYWLPLVVMGVGSAAATVMVLAADSTGPALVWAAAVVFGATAITWNTVGMLYILSEVEIAEAGRASGWVLVGFYGGFAASPALFGHSVDATGGYGLGWTVATVVFVAAALVAELGRRSRRRSRAAR